MAGHTSPTGDINIRTLMAGIRRSKGTAQDGKKPVLTADIRSMIAALPDGLLGIRDRALLLAGFAGAFRRSELVGLDVEDLGFTDDGLARISHHLTVEARDKAAITSLRLLTVLTVPFKCASAR